MSERPETCATCRYWEQVTADHGFCRGYPFPGALVEPAVARADDHCCQWRAGGRAMTSLQKAQRTPYLPPEPPAAWLRAIAETLPGDAGAVETRHYDKAREIYRALELLIAAERDGR